MEYLWNFFSSEKPKDDDVVLTQKLNNFEMKKVIRNSDGTFTAYLIIDTSARPVEGKVFQHTYCSYSSDINGKVLPECTMKYYDLSTNVVYEINNADGRVLNSTVFGKRTAQLKVGQNKISLRISSNGKFEYEKTIEGRSINETTANHGKISRSLGQDEHVYSVDTNGHITFNNKKHGKYVSENPFHLSMYLEDQPQQFSIMISSDKIEIQDEKKVVIDFTKPSIMMSDPSLGKMFQAK